MFATIPKRNEFAKLKLSKSLRLGIILLSLIRKLKKKQYIFKNTPLKILLLLSFLLACAFYDIIFLNKTFKVTTANSQALPNGVYGQEHNKPRFIPANGTDAPVSEEPIYEFIKQNLRRGILPLWNPHQACGYSLIGMLEIGIFYPLTFLVYWFPNSFSIDLLILSRLLLCGVFTFWFMRRIGFKNPPAVCSAIVFMLSGPMVLLQYWTANVDILLPVLLVAVDRLIIREADRMSIATLAIVVGLTIFAGHPEHIFFVNAFGLAFFIFRTLSLRTKKNYKKLIFGYLGAYLLGAGLASVVLLPFLRNLNTEFWSGHPSGTGLLMEEQTDRALSLALPHFFQKENLTFNFTFAGWWGGYLGTLPLALAFLSFFNIHKKGLNYFFGTLFVLILAKAYGLPFINWIGHLPIFDTCRYAIHTPPLAAFCVAVLSGMGVRSIQNAKNIFSKGLIFTFSLLIIVSAHLFALQKSEHFDIALSATSFAFGLLFIFQIILALKDRGLLKNKILNFIIIALVFSEMFLYIHREHPKRFDSFAKVPYIEFLKSQKELQRSYGIFWAFYPNTATGFGVDDLGYFLGLVPTRFVDFVNALVIENHFQKDLRPPALRAMPIETKRHFILDLLSVRYIITPANMHLENLFKTKPIYQNEVAIFERPTAMPYAYVVHRAIFEPDKKKSLNLVGRLGASSCEGVVITHAFDEKIISLLNVSPIKDASNVNIIHENPNEVILKARMEHAGLLVLTQAYHPDWKVFIDGKKSEILQTNYLLRGVLVPSGEHEIKFIFAPFSFYAGILISGISALFLVYFVFACPKKLNPRLRSQTGA